MRITVYRVEDCSGLGPYNRPPSLLLHHNCCPDHPTPYMRGEPLRWMEEDNPTSRFVTSRAWVCGFINPMQLNAWFTPEELRFLENMGYKVVEYHVPEEDIALGEKQICFFKP